MHEVCRGVYCASGEFPGRDVKVGEGGLRWPG